jgi:nitroreductase
MRLPLRKNIIVNILLVFLCGVSIKATPDDVSFPSPLRSGGLSLFAAFQSIRSTTYFERQLLHWEIVGNILWAALGINRPSQGGRTTPEIAHMRFLDAYVLAGEGCWRYIAAEHRLLGISSQDLRPLVIKDHQSESFPSASQNMPVVTDAKGMAPLMILFVAPELIGPRRSFGSTAFIAQEHLLWGVQAGLCAQNIYLFAVSEGLGAQLHVEPNREELATKLDITDKSRILIAVSVGYPAPL